MWHVVVGRGERIVVPAVLSLFSFLPPPPPPPYQMNIMSAAQYRTIGDFRHSWRYKLLDKHSRDPLLRDNLFIRPDGAVAPHTHTHRGVGWRGPSGAAANSKALLVRNWQPPKPAPPFPLAFSSSPLQTAFYLFIFFTFGLGWAALCRRTLARPLYLGTNRRSQGPRFMRSSGSVTTHSAA